MKRLFELIVILALIFLLPIISIGEDSKEVLILKHNLALERVIRVQTQLTLMQVQYKEGQELLKQFMREFEDLDKILKKMESEKEVIPKSSEEKGK